MIASVQLPAQNQSGKLPDIQAGQAFFTDPDFVQELVSSGKATVAPAGTPPPRQPPYSVRGVAGLGRGASNSSP